MFLFSKGIYDHIEHGKILKKNFFIFTEQIFFQEYIEME